jgi:hypothetical protein
MSALVLVTLFGENVSGDWKPVPGHLMTGWADDIDTDNPLPEYPRPQLIRENWVNLNGLWDFAVARYVPADGRRCGPRPDGPNRSNDRFGFKMEGSHMPKLVRTPLKYWHNVTTGRAVVTVNGRDRYLGKHRSKESRAEYARIIAEWEASKCELPADSPDDLTVTELVARLAVRPRFGTFPLSLTDPETELDSLHALLSRKCQTGKNVIESDEDEWQSEFLRAYPKTS